MRWSTPHQYKEPYIINFTNHYSFRHNDTEQQKKCTDVQVLHHLAPSVQGATTAHAVYPCTHEVHCTLLPTVCKVHTAPHHLDTCVVCSGADAAHVVQAAHCTAPPSQVCSLLRCRCCSLGAVCRSVQIYSCTTPLHFSFETKFVVWIFIFLA